MIRKFVQQAFDSKSLSSETEFNISHLFHKNCHLDDVDALIDLQQAVNSGYIQQESKVTHNRYRHLLVSQS